MTFEYLHDDMHNLLLNIFFEKLKNIFFSKIKFTWLVICIDA